MTEFSIRISQPLKILIVICFFVGYLQEETYRKMEDLCSMKEKLTAAKEDYQREWVSALRRSKALSLCFLLYIAMPSLNEISDLSLS